MIKSYHLYLKSHRAKVTPVINKFLKKRSYCWLLTCHEQFKNSSRPSVLNAWDPDPHICIVQSDRLLSKFVTGDWLQLVYMSKRTSSSNIFLLEFSFPLKFFILQSTNREADDVQMEQRGSWIKSRLANPMRRQVECSSPVPLSLGRG